MITAVLRKIFGSRNERLIKEMNKTVAKINALEPAMQALADEALKAKTTEFKERLAQGASVDSLLVEAFAVVREAGRRVLTMRHFDVQLIGGMVLHQGKIAEMRTGEGKTLVATLPLYLNALMGKGAHLVTVNDYLAKRDAAQMGKLYEFLGLTTGVIVPGLDAAARQAAYACDITYGTNNEFGFDYLRDNMVFSSSERVQRGLHFAVVDEVDSILIDEARTPLIISGAVEDSSALYIALTKVIPKLKKRESEEGSGDYFLDEKSKNAFLTDEGHEHVEEILTEMNLLKAGESLYSAANISILHYLNAVLRANTLYQKDVDYIVQDNEVVIIDPHTGRAMPGRRWSDGLHQAVEAKENVAIQAENQTLASTTFQNYFKLYDKLSGMTGTADIEAYELQQIYDLEVVVVPTNQPMVRKDYADLIYLTLEEKFYAIVEDIKTARARQQPILVGTASIETSEHLSRLLTRENIAHEVLNAKQHAREASIIAQAGKPGAVTIATNMAGRGTDIILGGNMQAEIEALEAKDEAAIAQIKKDWEARHALVKQAGGLYIIGSERHESRRIDNQLRGRSGRQGDPGMSRFYLSLQDNLVRIFASERLANIMRRLGMQKGEAIESAIVTKAIANAQKKVENHNFDIRKQLLQYDNVANDQRLVIYRERAALLDAQNVRDIVDNMRQDVVKDVVARYIPAGSMPELWDIDGLVNVLKNDFALDVPLKEWLDEDEALEEAKLTARMSEALQQAYQTKIAQTNPEQYSQFEKVIILQNLDTEWREHLSNLDHLRHSINLRGYAQKDPKQEYKREAFNLFSSMLDKFKYDVIATLSKVEIRQEIQAEENLVEKEWRRSVNNLAFQHQSLDGMGNQVKDEGKLPLPASAAVAKVGRNDPCPCGSGLKYKYCHGKIG